MKKGSRTNFPSLVDKRARRKKEGKRHRGQRAKKEKQTAVATCPFAQRVRVRHGPRTARVRLLFGKNQRRVVLAEEVVAHLKDASREKRYVISVKEKRKKGERERNVRRIRAARRSLDGTNRRGNDSEKGRTTIRIPELSRGKKGRGKQSVLGTKGEGFGILSRCGRRGGEDGLLQTRGRQTVLLSSP